MLVINHSPDDKNFKPKKCLDRERERFFSHIMIGISLIVMKVLALQYIQVFFFFNFGKGTHFWYSGIDSITDRSRKYSVAHIEPVKNLTYVRTRE